MRKVAFFPIHFIQKRLYWTQILRSPPFHYNHGEVWFLSHKYARNTMNITYAKFKKTSRSRFFKLQPARASLRTSVLSVSSVGPIHFIALFDNLEVLMTLYARTPTGRFTSMRAITTITTMIDNWHHLIENADDLSL